MEKLNIGCGNNIMENWLNADCYLDDPRIFPADIRSLPKEWVNTFEEILCSHVLEHLSFEEIPKALKELFRVLKPGGKCVFVIPDLEYAAQLFFSCKDGTLLKEWAARTLYGMQTHLGEFHKSGFTKESAELRIKQVGFIIDLSTAGWSHEQKSFVIQCRKEGAHA